MIQNSKSLPVRLTHEAIELIKHHVLSCDTNARVYIFGSRAHLQKKGGDIDILIISKIFDFSHAQKLRIALQNLIGEQKVDIVYARDKISDPFIKIILEDAVEI